MANLLHRPSLCGSTSEYGGTCVEARSRIQWAQSGQSCRGGSWPIGVENLSLLVLTGVVGVAITASVGGGEVETLALEGEVEIALDVEVDVVSLAVGVRVVARLIAVTVV